MKKIICIIYAVIYLSSGKVFSQQDTINGYNDFIFGQTLNEIVKILNKKVIYFNDKEQQRFNFTGKCYIKYNDVVDMFSMNQQKTIYYPMDVRLYFDSLNNMKFYEAEISINNETGTLENALEETDLLLGILIKKYGSNYIMDDFMDFKTFGPQKIGDSTIYVYPISKIYTWKFNEIIISVHNHYQDFYRDENVKYQLNNFGDVVYTNREYRIIITYRNKYLSDLEMENRFNKYNMDYIKEEQEKLKKF